jgi:hypothetical protein
MISSPIRLPIPWGPRSVKCFSASGYMANQLQMPRHLRGHLGSGQRHDQYRVCNLDHLSNSQTTDRKYIMTAPPQVAHRSHAARLF